jgi:ATP-dependent exoDNAse (exonuclease V) beta subunit
LAPPAADGAEGDAAGAGAAPSDGLRVLWAHEDNATKWAPPAPDAADPSASPAKARVVLRPSRSVRSRRRRAPSASKDVAVVRAADLCTTEPKAGAARGSVFHEWLSRIEWLDDGTPREDALRCIAHEVSRRDELGVSATQVESWLGELRPILLGESVRELLTHGGSEQKPELWRERRFAVVLDEQGEQSLVQGAFDRVHLTYRDGAPVGAEVIDFKTGRVDPERYRPQMEVYRRALAALTGLPAEPGSIRCTLLFLDEDELREV